ncbi:MAG: hypothetical protein AAGA56_07595 [Myxococcota bacterium]
MGARLEADQHRSALDDIDFTGEDHEELITRLAFFDEVLLGGGFRQLGQADHFDQFVVVQVGEDRDPFENGDPLLGGGGRFDGRRGAADSK